jgi:drug/metabolite transporter (DMT)-like permease
MPNLLAAFASISWGCADFLGGAAAKRLDVKRVGALAQATGLLGIAVVLWIFPADPRTHDLVWGLAAGVATAAGVMMLYRALAIGPMYAAASITAVVGAASNASFGLISGERPSSLAFIGIPLAIASLVLVSASPTSATKLTRTSRVVLVLGAGAGVSLGISNACFAATSPGSGSWPVAVSRLVATIILGSGALALRGSGRWDGIAVRYAVAAGVADIAATASIAYALQRGPQVLIGVLGSLFPVVTVLLARIVLHESMSRKQAIGLVCAVAAVALISAS